MIRLCTSRKWLISIPIVYAALSGFVINIIACGYQTLGLISLKCNLVFVLAFVVLTLLFIWHQIVADRKREELRASMADADTLRMVFQMSIPSMGNRLAKQIENGDFSDAINAARVFAEIRSILQ